MVADTLENLVLDLVLDVEQASYGEHVVFAFDAGAHHVIDGLLECVDFLAPLELCVFG